MQFFPAALLVLSVSVVASSACAAQQQPEPAAEGARRGMGGLILQGITLTEAQKTQQKAIREKYAPQLQQVRQTAQTTGTTMDEARLSQIRAAQLSELRAILTADQQVIFDRNTAEMRARAERRGSQK